MTQARESGGQAEMATMVATQALTWAARFAAPSANPALGRAFEIPAAGTALVA